MPMVSGFAPQQKIPEIVATLHPIHLWIGADNLGFPTHGVGAGGQHHRNSQAIATVLELLP
ncbi:MAG: hypothetical protein RLZZ490_92 [Cyanobacteriota bacterium]